MADPATAESPVTPSAQQQAIDMLTGVDLTSDVEDDSGSTPALVETAPPAAVPDAAPTATPPAADDVAELLAKLEARKAERAAKQQPDVVGQLQAQIAALEAKLSHPPAHVPQDFPALVRQHGEVEAMRMVGIDPLEFFARFKTVAKDPDSIRRQQAELEHSGRLKELADAQAKQNQTLEQWQAQQKADADRAAWSAYVHMVEQPESGTPLLAKLPVMERVKRTQDKIGWLQSNGYPVDEIDDGQLAKLVEKDIRSLRDLLAGTEADVKTTPKVPATDGAKRPETASLTNDLASQTTGSERRLTEKERVAQAVKIMQTASD